MLFGAEQSQNKLATTLQDALLTRSDVPDKIGSLQWRCHKLMNPREYGGLTKTDVELHCEGICKTKQKMKRTNKDGERGMATHPTARCRMSKPSCSEATGLQSSRGGSQHLVASGGGPRRRLAAVGGGPRHLMAASGGGLRRRLAMARGLLWCLAMACDGVWLWPGKDSGH